MKSDAWTDTLVDMHDALAGMIGVDDNGPAEPDQGHNTDANRRLRDALLWAIYSPRTEVIQ